MCKNPCNDVFELLRYTPQYTCVIMRIIKDIFFPLMQLSSRKVLLRILRHISWNFIASSWEEMERGINIDMLWTGTFCDNKTATDRIKKFPLARQPGLQPYIMYDNDVMSFHWSVKIKLLVIWAVRSILGFHDPTRDMNEKRMVKSIIKSLLTKIRDFNFLQNNSIFYSFLLLNWIFVKKLF
jgi:hypothetical protein